MQAIDAALAPKDYISPDEYTSRSSGFNNTVSVGQTEHLAMIDVAASVQAYLYGGASREALERVFLRYSELCDAHADRAREIAAKDKADSDLRKERKKALRSAGKELAELAKESKRVKIGFMLSRYIDKACAAVDRALEIG